MALSQVERNRRWRERYPEKYRQYQRELMRKRRARERADSGVSDSGRLRESED